MYVANRGTGDVLVIDSDSNTVIDSIEIGTNPYVIKFNPYNEYMYVTNAVDVSVIDPSTNTVIDRIEAGSFPYDFIFNTSNHLM